MIELRYSDVERQLVELLPEIRPAADFYWKTEGAPGQHSGPYVFFDDVFGCYLEVLLWLPSTARRDELLHRAFAAVDQLLGRGDAMVRELAAIGLLEGADPAWLKRARPFVGSRARAWLRKHNSCWRDCALSNDQILPRILDGYHVRTVVARALECSLDRVPGTTYAKESLPDMPLQPPSRESQRDGFKD